MWDTKYALYQLVILLYNWILYYRPAIQVQKSLHKYEQVHSM